MLTSVIVDKTVSGSISYQMKKTSDMSYMFDIDDVVNFSRAASPTQKITFRLEDPEEKLLWIWGFRVGVDSLTIYVGGPGDDRVIPVGSFLKLMYSVFRVSCSPEKVMSLLQKFKLNGKMEEFVKDYFSSVYSGNSITYTLVAGRVNTAVEVSSYTRALYETLTEYGMCLWYFTGCLLKAVSNDMDLQKRDYISSYLKGVVSVQYVYKGLQPSTKEAFMFRISTKAYNTVPSLRGDLEKASLAKALNLYDLCETMEQEHEVIFSMDIGNWLDRVGMKNLLTSREVSSLNNCWKILHASNSVFNRATLLKVTPSQGSVGMYVTGTLRDFTRVCVAFNKGLVMLDKLLLKMEV